MQEQKHIVVAITGATGIIYAQRLLEVCQQLPEIHTHLIISPAGQLTLKQESEISLQELKGLADQVHNYQDIGNKLSSGSVKTHGMVVVPCSIKTLSSIAHSYDADLITRCADVHLKERRPIILCVRETPLHLGHLRLMTQVAEYGAQIMPLVPAFYHQPQTIDDIVNQSVARLCDQLGIVYPTNIFTPWQGLKPNKV
ncbi:3-octaprenyl-4-hydroxybenzoate carboxy-lyase [Psittacicella hinzii]|uniref:Flavin prenyltransferase UbiX n=1 Tax=Psittacicella hinzii TaxID=2028575 RepID=A0A3A1Y0L7_9GAMM|nr:UbiX family flavin prenyltransferase [Psittacicella hinzii]RIY31135.1 3-octaprenyl-4-hydroxybenzoate carboxy-lyase [Psittacicella hinzii]